MTIFKLLILVFGALGLGLVLSDNIAAAFEHDKANTLFIVGGFAITALMGLLGMIKPPMQGWQATAALAGFAVVAIRTRIWTLIPDVMDQRLRTQLMIVATVGGTIAAVLAVIKPDRTA
ncbi:MAG: hypothetical protein AB7P03_23540 [Kofleriaceae bacterium]